MVFAGIVRAICGPSCDAGETILGLALIFGGFFSFALICFLVFQDD